MEFSSEKEIRYLFGEEGITSYQCEEETDMAVVSGCPDKRETGHPQQRVAEEAFAIAMYCSLRYQDDFSKAVIAAVNHDGDSDSTGAITGNIVGAAVGCRQIDSRWKEKLEFHPLLRLLADDLCYGCRMSEYGSYVDREWRKKYIKCRKPKNVKV